MNPRAPEFSALITILRLVDVSQDVIITIEDCDTELGLWVERQRPDGTVAAEAAEHEFRGSLLGRTAGADVVHPDTGEVIVARGVEISDRVEEEDGTQRDLVAEIAAAGVEKVFIRTVMACEATYGVCQLCYP